MPVQGDSVVEAVLAKRTGYRSFCDRVIDCARLTSQPRRRCRWPPKTSGERCGNTAQQSSLCWPSCERWAGSV